MSPSKISFGGILQPLIESLERSPRQTGRLVGQDVVLPAREDIQAVIALDSENDIHLLISPAAVDESRFLQLEFRGLKIANREWTVVGRVTQQYLDITCSTGSLPSFRRPFLRFAEDVLYEISRAGILPGDAAHRTALRWKRFWSADVSAEISMRWLHGLFGELTFLMDLVQRFGPAVIRAWSGPLGKDHDFQVGTDLAVEVKASVDVPFKIRCNIRQLDTSIFKKLYVVCYRIVSSENGATLSAIVEEIENMIGDDEQALDSFHEKLVSAGYSRQLEQVYNQCPLEISSAAAFLVDDLFPKIAESSFVNPPDHRITDIRYTLQLTGIEALTLDTIEQELAHFGKNKRP
ncbi:MAG: PD-(D/E)XK motif protein [bacterium]|nr:PD-(D/E)XK motif protein [bacterium]